MSTTLTFEEKTPIIIEYANYPVKGDKGEKGNTGESGPQGIQGIQGEKGDTGDTGPIGPVGPQGEQGIQGIQGEKGEKGEKGSDGVMTFQDLTDEQKAGLKGEKGDQGEKGEQGEKGDTGAQGPQGENAIGSLIDTNNLSDLTNKATARNNLDVYSKSEVNTELSEKADSNHTHDDRYYTESEMQGAIPNKPTKINSGSDLNNYKTPGYYYNSSNAETANISNTPIDKAFSLVVMQTAGIIQIYYGYGGNKSYIRQYYNNWNSWKEIVINGLTNELRVGTTDTTGNLANYPSIVIGDSDTGFRQNGDGKIEMWANNQLIGYFTYQQARYYKKLLAGYSQPDDADSFTRKDYVDGNMDNKSIKVLTQAQFDALATKDSDTIYHITA